MPRLPARATRRPPTSRKLAGSPPCSLMMSIVAIASPAPLTIAADIAVQLDVVEVVLERLSLHRVFFVLVRNSITSEWRNSALSSNAILASRAITSPVPVTSGLISTIEASSPTKAS